ncbi:MAG: hypothetical protein GC162_10915 [Planctomycetes bacterium]|nr:hypothetical protein [Planctomycetota bacterium]
MARNVVIMGSGRSGTSLVAGSIAGSLTGYHLGERLVEAREANPKGFFESRSINAINEAIMGPVVEAMTDGPGHRQYWLAALPPEVQFTSLTGVQERVDEAVSRVPWCYKDPRFCYTLPAWRPRIGDAALLCVFRHPGATAASIVKEVNTAPYLRDLSMSIEQAMEVWCAMYGRVLDQLADQGDWLFVHAQQMFDPAALDRLDAFIDAKVDRDFPTPSLQRSEPAGATERAMKLYKQLCERAGWDERRG